jgi:hypothetical protein
VPATKSGFESGHEFRQYASQNSAPTRVPNNSGQFLSVRKVKPSSWYVSVARDDDVGYDTLPKKVLRGTVTMYVVYGTKDDKLTKTR